MKLSAILLTGLLAATVASAQETALTSGKSLKGSGWRMEAVTIGGQTVEALRSAPGQRKNVMTWKVLPKQTQFRASLGCIDGCEGPAGPQWVEIAVPRKTLRFVAQPGTAPQPILLAFSAGKTHITITSTSPCVALVNPTLDSNSPPAPAPVVIEEPDGRTTGGNDKTEPPVIESEGDSAESTANTGSSPVAPGSVTAGNCKPVGANVAAMLNDAIDTYLREDFGCAYDKLALIAGKAKGEALAECHYRLAQVLFDGRDDLTGRFTDPKAQAEYHAEQTLKLATKESPYYRAAQRFLTRVRGYPKTIMVFRGPGNVAGLPGQFSTLLVNNLSENLKKGLPDWKVEGSFVQSGADEMEYSEVAADRNVKNVAPSFVLGLLLSDFTTSQRHVDASYDKKGNQLHPAYTEYSVRAKAATSAYDMVQGMRLTRHLFEVNYATPAPNMFNGFETDKDVDDAVRSAAASLAGNLGAASDPRSLVQVLKRAYEDIQTEGNWWRFQVTGAKVPTDLYAVAACRKRAAASQTPLVIVLPAKDRITPPKGITSNPLAADLTLAIVNDTVRRLLVNCKESRVVGYRELLNSGLNIGERDDEAIAAVFRDVPGGAKIVVIELREAWWNVAFAPPGYEPKAQVGLAARVIDTTTGKAHYLEALGNDVWKDRERFVFIGNEEGKKGKKDEVSNQAPGLTANATRRALVRMLKYALPELGATGPEIPSNVKASYEPGVGLKASWACDDPHSGIAEYQYACAEVGKEPRDKDWESTLNTEVANPEAKLARGKQNVLWVKAANGVQVDSEDTRGRGSGKVEMWSPVAKSEPFTVPK